MVERSVMALRGRQDRRIVFDYWPHTQKEKKTSTTCRHTAA